jgi:hypothetical protein
MGADTDWTSRDTLVVLLLMACALGLRLWALGYPLFYDEGFHILAARSWLETGTLCIADCTEPYDRANLFTLLVAFSFALFGESPETARLPSVIAGTLLVGAVFVWVRREISAGAAVIAAGLCAVAPELIGWSQTARFYVLQALLVWCGIALCYSGLGSRTWQRRTAALLGSAACFSLALSLQVSTLIPVAALSLWVLGWVAVRRERVSLRAQLLIGSGGALLALLVLALQWGSVMELWAQYRNDSNLHTLADVGDVFFYHSWFVWMYSYLYALLPLAIVAAIAVSPGPSLLLTVVFAVSFVAHSFGGFKAERFILYAFPLFFTLWAVALSELVPRLVAYSRRALTQIASEVSGRMVELGAWSALAAAFAFAALNTEAVQTTVRLVVVPSTEWSGPPWYRGGTDWTAARPALDPLMRQAEVVVSSAQIKTLYELDRTDVSLSRTELFDGAGGGDFPPEFWVYPVTGRPVISTAASVERVVSCYSSGLFLVENGHWRLPAVVTDEAADAIEELTQEVELPGRTRIKAFMWQHDPTASPEACSQLRG